LKTEYFSEGAPEQIRNVVEGRYHAGIGTLPVDEASLSALCLYQEPMLVVLRKDHRLARKRRVHVSELGDDPVILELAEEVYQRLSEFTSRGGPFAAIYDLSAAKRTTIPTDMVRSFARRRPSIPIGRTHVVVGKEPVIYGLARVFQMCGEFLGNQFDVVWALEEAYDIVGARPEDFTEYLIWPRATA
jgi:DNA-binding transcriptional LysR family regulator